MASRKLSSNSNNALNANKISQKERKKLIELYFFLENLGHHEEGLVDIIKSFNPIIKHLEIVERFKWPGDIKKGEEELIARHVFLVIDAIKSGEISFEELVPILMELNNTLSHKNKRIYFRIFLDMFMEEFKEIIIKLGDEHDPMFFSQRDETEELTKKEERTMKQFIDILNIKITDDQFVRKFFILKRDMVDNTETSNSIKFYRLIKKMVGLKDNDKPISYNKGETIINKFRLADVKQKKQSKSKSNNNTNTLNLRRNVRRRRQGFLNRLTQKKQKN